MSCICTLILWGCCRSSCSQCKHQSPNCFKQAKSTHLLAQRCHTPTPPPVKPWPLQGRRWACSPTRTCTQCSGSRWRGRQRSRSCLLPALHQLYEWSFEKQPQFELHLHNTANGTEFRIKHSSEQHAPCADGRHLLKSSLYRDAHLRLNWYLRTGSYFSCSVHLLGGERYAII